MNDSQSKVNRGSRGLLWYDVVDDMIERLESRVEVLEAQLEEQDKLLEKVKSYLRDKREIEAEEIDNLYASIYPVDDNKLSDL